MAPHYKIAYKYRSVIIGVMLICAVLCGCVGWSVWNCGLKPENEMQAFERKCFGDLSETDYDLAVVDIDKRYTAEDAKEISKPYLIYKTLYVPFEVKGKGKLVVAEPNEGGHGMPAEAFQRLILVYPGKAKAIQLNNISGLRNRVKIRNEKEALSFCRLRTSPLTWYLLSDDSKVELVDLKQVNNDFCFGDKETYEYLHTKVDTGYLGIVKSSMVMIKLGGKKVKVIKNGREFKIYRTLLVQKIGSSGWYYLLQDIVETVGVDGSYSCKDIQQRKLPKTNIHLYIPMFL